MRVEVGISPGAVNMGDRPPPVFVGVPPPLPRSLVGRDASLAALRAKICNGEATALTGLPGVGKTALATALVYDSAVREHFRGGVLWVGLGTLPNSDSAIEGWAAALGIDLSAEQDARVRGQMLSAALQQRARGEPVLLVMDDAWSWKDVQPFREFAFPGCAHLITTRDASVARKFAGEATSVDELTDEQAEALLVERCPKAKEVDPQGVRDLVRAVGGLPLALTLMAATLCDHAEQAHWVRGEIARLHATEARLTLETPSVRPGLEGIPNTLRAIIEMSLEALGEDLSLAFDALAAFAPKPASFSQEAAFTVWGLGIVTGAEMVELVWSAIQNALKGDWDGDKWLRILVERGLLEVAGEGRFALHQVLAAVAGARLGEDRTPRLQHACFYLVTAAGKKWPKIDLEMAQIRHAWTWCSDAREEIIVLTLALTLSDFALHRGLRNDLLTWSMRGLDAARALGQRGEEGALLNNIGLLVDPKDAPEYYELAIAIHREVGNRAYEANTLINWGQYYLGAKDHEQARKCFEQALTIRRETNDRGGEAQALSAMGRYFLSIGDKERASAFHEQALATSRLAGDRAAEALALESLGVIYTHSENPQRAMDFYDQALHIQRARGDLVGEVNTLLNLGATCGIERQDDRRRKCYEQAFMLLQRTEDDVGRLKAPIAGTLSQNSDLRLKMAAMLNELGTIHLTKGDYRRALGYLEQALPISRELGNSALEGAVTTNLGTTHLAMGNPKRALELCEAALPRHREAGNRTFEANTLICMGNAYRTLGEHERALDFYGQCLRIGREEGDRYREMIALDGIGATYFAVGDRKQARDHFEKSLSLATDKDARMRVKLLNKLGINSAATGDHRAARSYYEQALQVYAVAGIRDPDATMLDGLGSAYEAIDDKNLARECYERSLALWREQGNRSSEGNVLSSLGRVLHALGDKSGAQICYQQALDIHREVGNRFGEVFTLSNFAKLRLSEWSMLECYSLVRRLLPIVEAMQRDDLNADRVLLEQARAMSRRVVYCGIVFVVSLVLVVTVAVLWRLLKH